MDLHDEQVLTMKAGDHYGFTWLDYGVIDYSDTGTEHFCGAAATYIKGDRMITAKTFERVYSLQLTFVSRGHGEDGSRVETVGEERTSYTLGAEPVDRPRIDDSQGWTMVNLEPVMQDGQIEQIEFFAGAENRRLHVGIYRPITPTQPPTSCQFTLVQQTQIDRVNISPGYQKVREQ